MTFRFRLQRVLELREQAEQARARDLQQAAEVADGAQRRHDLLAELHSLQRHGLSAAARGEISAGVLQHMSLILGELGGRVQDAATDLAGAEAIVAEARGKLEVAARDRQVLDRLRDRSAEQWRQSEVQHDRQQMDDIALGRFTRQQDGRASSSATATPSPTTTSDTPTDQTSARAATS